MSDKILDDRLDIRINKEDKILFSERCKNIDRVPQSVLREMVLAFNEGKLKIRASSGKIKSLREMYDAD